MTDEELRAILGNLASAQIKTEEQLAKTDAQFAKTEAQLVKTFAKIDKYAEMYGEDSNNQGRVAEEFFFNSLKRNPVLNGIHFDFIDKNVTRSKAGIEEEYDLLLVNGRAIYIVEVKYCLHPKDVERMVGRKLTNFKKLFPEYKNYQIHLALASFAVDDDVKRMALDQGVTVLQRHGDVFETLAA
jgi:hypothetical protein